MHYTFDFLHQKWEDWVKRVPLIPSLFHGLKIKIVAHAHSLYKESMFMEMDKKQSGVIKAVNKFLPWYFAIIQIRYHSWLFLDQLTKYMYTKF